MIKKCLLFLLVSSGCFVQAQELFFSTGKNFTTYNYKNSLGITNSNLRSGEGSFYQLGMDIKLSKSVDPKKLTYAVSLVYNQFNAIGGTSTDNYSWKTNYLGVQNALNFTFIEVSKSFKVKTKLGYGKPNNIIPEIINKGNFDVLVMGTHGHTGIKDLLFGTTVDKLRHKISIPLFIVKN